MPRTTLHPQRGVYRCGTAGCSVRWTKISSTMGVTITTIIHSTPTSTTLNVTPTACALRHRQATTHVFTHNGSRVAFVLCLSAESISHGRKSPTKFGQDLVTDLRWCHSEGHGVDESFEPPTKVTTVARQYRPNTVLTQATCNSMHELVKDRALVAKILLRTLLSGTRDKRGGMLRVRAQSTV